MALRRSDDPALQMLLAGYASGRGDVAEGERLARHAWDILRVLDDMEQRFPTSWIGRIAGTLEPDPRYRVAIWTHNGAQRHIVPSAEAFARFRLDQRDE